MFKREEYREHLKELMAEAGIPKHEMTDIIREELERHLGPDEVFPSEQTINSWASGYRNFPPIGVLAILARELSCSMGYLLGQHDVREIKIHDIVPTFDYQKILKEHKHDNNQPLFGTKKINSAWIRDRKESTTMLTNMRPFINLIEETGFTLDYCVGVSDVKFWQSFCFEHGLYEKVKDYPLILFTPHNGKDPFYGIRTEDGNKVLLPSGEIVMIDRLRTDHDAKLIRKVVFW